MAPHVSRFDVRLHFPTFPLLSEITGKKKQENNCLNYGNCLDFVCPEDSEKNKMLPLKYAAEKKKVYTTVAQHP